MTIDQMLENLLAVEGGYVNDPADSGGETNFGITLRTARKYNYLGPMKDLPRNKAKDIYRQMYWEEPRFDLVFSRAPKVAEELFDTGVNMGPTVASFFLQRILTALNNGGRDYADLKPDGKIGSITLASLDAFLRKRGSQGEVLLVHTLDALQGERYVSLCENNPKNEKFLYGWLANRLDNVKDV